MAGEVMIRGDEGRAKQIFPRLIEAYETKELSWLKSGRLPQERFLPSSIVPGSYQHRCFLWFIAPLMRGSINSDFVFSKIAVLYQKEPLLFLPAAIADGFSTGEIEVLLKEVGIEYLVEEFAESWKRNGENLMDFDGEPLKVFEGAIRYRDVWDVLIGDGPEKRFSGWGEKIVSLLILWFEEAGFISPLFGPPPVDFHVIRVLVATAILQLQGLGIGGRIARGKVIQVALSFLEEVCEKNKFLTSALDGAMWLLSRNGCRVQPKRCHWCPIEGFCSFFIPYYGRREKGKLRLLPRRRPRQLFLKI